MKKSMRLDTCPAIALAFLILIGMVIGAGCGVYASEAGVGGYVQDGANLLSGEEETSLADYCASSYNTEQILPVIVTADEFSSLGCSDAIGWLDQVYESQGLDQYDSVIIFGISMEERDWAICSYGAAESIFTSDVREQIGEAAASYLSDGDYEKAFASFLADVEKGSSSYRETGKVKTVSGSGLKNIPFIIFGSFAISLIIACCIVLSWKAQMNTRVLQSGAAVYLDRGSFRLKRKDDIFLYHTVTRTRKQQKSSSGTRSSGHGSSGKF